VEAALGRGANVNSKRGHYEKAPLHGAAHNGHVEVAQVLLAAGADVNARNQNENTSLIIAAVNGCVEVAQVLLAAGADLEAKNNVGKTALDYAKQRGHAAIVAMIEQSEPLTKSAAQGGAADADQ